MISYTTSLLNKAMDGAAARGKLKGKAAAAAVGPEDIMFLVRKVGTGPLGALAPPLPVDTARCMA